jgi:hypothetical protein
MIHVKRRIAMGSAALGLVALGLVAPQVVSAAFDSPAVGVTERQTPALIPDEAFWSYPLCEVEDASSGPLPCLWPADRVGNGIGNTFYVEPGPHGSRCFFYVNPNVARKWNGCDES